LFSAWRCARKRSPPRADLAGIVADGDGITIAVLDQFARPDERLRFRIERLRSRPFLRVPDGHRVRRLVIVGNPIRHHFPSN
jgi:hypothetical protein